MRAFTAQDVLLTEHRRIADDQLDEAVRVGLEQNRATTTGRGLAGVGSAIGFVVLGLLLYAGGLPLALGGTAVLAVRSVADGAATMLSRRFQKGRDLSGGQWQRLSVARGLYRDAPLVVADGPTAALDARAEHALFASLRAMGGTEKS